MSNATVSDTFKPMSVSSLSAASVKSDSKSILPSLSAVTGSATTTGSTTSSIWGYIKSISFTTWLIIILLLAFIGFNIFVYLAKGTQSINEVFGPVFKKILVALGMTASQTVDVAATGTKTVVNTTADVTDAGLTNVQNVLPTSDEGQGQGQTSTQGPTSTQGQTSTQGPISTKGQPDISTTNRALNTQKAAESNNGYQEDDATSNIQMGGTKSGYCYIGEDRGYRSCAYVGEGDKCISGEIFPTNEICINPNLRT